MATTYTLKQIHSTLMRAAECYPDAAGDAVPNATFHFGTLIIRCRPTKPAIRRVAEKYRRGNRAEGLVPHSNQLDYQKLRTIGPYDWRKV